ncbi:MAG: TolC family protein [Bacteroidales bacterium]
MLKRVIYVLLLFFPVCIFAQEGLDSVLKQAENNSLSFQNLIQANQLEILEAKKDIWPDQPSVDFGFGRDSKSAVSKTTYGASQEISFPTVWVQKIRLKNHIQEKAKFSEEAFRQDLLLEVRRLFSEAVFYNKRIARDELRAKNAKEIYRFLKVRLEKGDANILEYNKSRIEYEEQLANLRQDKAKKQEVMGQLKWFCQNPTLKIVETSYEKLVLPLYKDVEQNVISADPFLKNLEAQQRVDMQSAKIRRSEWVPNLSFSYEGERAPGVEYQGAKLGLNIPLWANKSRAQQATAIEKKAFFEYSDKKGIYLSNLKSLYKFTVSSQENYLHLDKAIKEYPALKLLEKALNSGQISVLQYYQEIEDYYQLESKLLDMEKEYYQNLAKLLKYSF